MKHIGIVACSAEGAALCYKTIAAEGAAMMGGHDHPEVSMHTHCLGDYIRCIHEGRWDSVGDLMLSSAGKLTKCGADFLICPDNTIHQAFDYVAAKSSLPWLHIADVVADEAVRRGFRCLGLTGTRWLVESEVYPSRLEPRGQTFRRPSSEDRQEVNRIIFDELVLGVFEPSSRTRLVEVIRRLKADGADAVVLGCTEIPLIIDDAVSPLPTLDSTRLLARAALELAIQ